MEPLFRFTGINCYTVPSFKCVSNSEMEQAVFKKISSASHFELPLLDCSLPLECHPNYAYQVAEANRWIVETMGIKDARMKKELVQSRLALCAPLSMPRGVCDERMILMSQHTFMFFLFDDMMESIAVGDDNHVETVKDKVMQVAAGVYTWSDEEKADKYAPVWSIFEGTLSTMRETWPESLFSRYLCCLSKYLDCVVKEVRSIKANLVMDEFTYRIVRRETIFVEAAGALFGEFCMKITLKEEQTQSQDFKDLVNSMIDHTTLVNDLFSFRKEYYQKSSHNWVCVLLAHAGGVNNLQEAIDRVYKMINEEELKMKKLQSILVKKAIQDEDVGLMNFVDALPLIASGHVRWVYVTGRYHGYDNPLISGEPFYGTVLMHPFATIVMPPAHKCQQHSHPLLFDPDNKKHGVPPKTQGKISFQKVSHLRGFSKVGSSLHFGTPAFV